MDGVRPSHDAPIALRVLREANPIHCQLPTFARVLAWELVPEQSLASADLQKERSIWKHDNYAK
jgi:hypothetical protein